jgi:hypothetical protein
LCICWKERISYLLKCTEKQQLRIRKISFDLCSDIIYIVLSINPNLTVSWLIIPPRQYTHCVGWQLHIFHSVTFPILSRNEPRIPNQFVLRICKGSIYFYLKVRHFPSLDTGQPYSLLFSLRFDTISLRVCLQFNFFNKYIRYTCKYIVYIYMHCIYVWAHTLVLRHIIYSTILTFKVCKSVHHYTIQII